MRSELPLRVILKRLPCTVDPEDVKLELISQGYPVRAVKQFTKKEGDKIFKLPTFLMELDNNEQGKKIFDLNRLFYTVVSIVLQTSLWPETVLQMPEIQPYVAWMFPYPTMFAMCKST